MQLLDHWALSAQPTLFLRHPLNLCDAMHNNSTQEEEEAGTSVSGLVDRGLLNRSV